MVSWILRKVLGSKNQREIRRIRPLVENINRLEEEFQALTDDQLREKTANWKRDLANIDDPDELARRLRSQTPAVMGRLREGKLLLDLRTVFPEQEKQLVDAIGQALHAE